MMQESNVKYLFISLFCHPVDLSPSSQISKRRRSGLPWTRGLRLSLACTQAVLQESSAPRQSRFRYDLETRGQRLSSVFLFVFMLTCAR